MLGAPGCSPVSTPLIHHWSPRVEGLATQIWVATHNLRTPGTLHRTLDYNHSV